MFPKVQSQVFPNTLRASDMNDRHGALQQTKSQERDLSVHRHKKKWE